MTNRTKATRLFKAELDLKAARRRVETLEAKCKRLAAELEAPQHAETEFAIPLSKAS